MASARPTGLSVVIILGVILGGLGTLSSIYGLVATAIPGGQEAQQKAILDMANVQGADRALQERLARLTREKTDQWKPYTLSVAGLNLVVSGLLVGACVLMLRWSRVAPFYFSVTVGVGFLVDLLSAVVASVMSSDMASLIEESFLLGAGQTADNASTDLAQVMDATSSAMMVMSVCMALVWLLAKGAYYVSAVIYLRKEKVRGLFTA